MKSYFYTFQSANDSLMFEFESSSESKIIRKIISFTPFPENPVLYNVALGDILEDGQISDLSVSNNGDLNKVIGTVIQTFFKFFETYPDCFLYIIGSTAERTRLYRIIISKELKDATIYFKVYGIINFELEIFKLNRPYESFVIKLK